MRPGPAAACAALALLACAPEARRPDAPRCPGCNVVLVTYDALRADHLGIYGYPRATSPEIDALGRRSSVFTRCLSQSASTISSIPSLHTSRFPSSDAILDAEGVLRPEERTLAEALSDAGYATLAVIAHDYARCEWGACQGFEHVDEDYAAPESAVRTRERALRLLDRHAREPFLLWIHFRHPHSPYRPLEAVFQALHQPEAEGPTFYAPELRGRPLAEQLRFLVGHYAALGEPVSSYRFAGDARRMTPSVVRQIVSMYDGNVREGDRQLGLLLDHLAERGLAERTLVVVASDHGESLGEHGIFGHNLLWYPMLHTPLVVHVPGAPAAVIDRPVMNVDVMPTLLEVLGLELPERIRGVSLFGAGRPEPFQFAEYGTSSETLVRGRWKLVVAGLRENGALRRVPMLFDIAEDPGEQRDLSGAHPEIVEALSGVVERIRAEGLAEGGRGAERDVRERLRALGYIR